MRLRRLAVLVLVLTAELAHAGEPERKPRSVVLFIGDGMGLAHVTLGRLAAEHAGRPYVFDRFKTIGLCATRSANNIVTDSAAASTALSSGYKTNNGFLGIDPEKRARTTILELAHAAGLRTGLVTTTTITNATPAGFASHVSERNDEGAVAAQYLGEGVDVLMGGGQKYFPAARLAVLAGQGYSYVASAEALRAFPVRDGTKLLGVFTPGHMSYEIDRDPGREPSLREMTVKALDLLGKGGRPFFCMIEGGKIDHSGHLHDAMSLVHEQLAFADAIGAALEHVERGDDLLVIATADHTTGGLALSEKLDLDGLAKVKISGEALVAKYPGVKLTESYATFKKVVEENYFFTPTEAELATARNGHGEWGHVTAVQHAVSLHFGVGFFDLDHQQLLQNATHGHEGSLVPVFSAGPGADRFTGIFDNTSIPKEVARLLGLPSPGALVGEKKRFY